LAASGDGHRQNWGGVEEGEKLTFTSYAFIFISLIRKQHAFFYNLKASNKIKGNSPKIIRTKLQEMAY